jgi:GGDEF domain-containing protein
LTGLDLNGLKMVNDRLDHLASEVLSKAIEEAPHACRVGGDEFAILMPDTNPEGA